MLKTRTVRTPGEPPAGEAPMTVVLMHGFGAPGTDLVGLEGALDAPPGTTFVFPEALHSLTALTGAPMFGDARAWWLIDMARVEEAMMRGEVRDMSREVPPGLAAAREAVIALLAELPQERLVLGGFSQGAMLALDVALRTETKLSGLVLLSGTMLCEDEWRPRMPARAGLPVFQSHGTADPILGYALAERVRDALTEAGLAVTFDRFAGAHGIPPTTLSRLAGWLRALPA